jgi:hypothetical protein
MRDVVAKDGSMELTRKEITRCWAKIDLYRAHGSFISPQGFAILEPAHRQTHVVIVRAALGLDFTSAACQDLVPSRRPRQLDRACRPPGGKVR